MRTISLHFLSTTLRYIVEAIDCINKKYYAQKKAKLIYGKHVIQEGQTFSESTFSHKLAPAIEHIFERENWHIDKYFETEISKQIIFRNEEKKETYGPTFNQLWDDGPDDHEQFYAKPDIVIHAGAEDFQKKNQLFIAELKTNPKLTQSQFNIDLFKTAVYHDDLEFGYSAFIIINVSEDDVRDMYNAYCAKGYYLSGRKGMYIIIKNGYENPSKVFLIN
jgi:hypothetical protein